MHWSEKRVYETVRLQFCISIPQNWLFSLFESWQLEQFASIHDMHYIYIIYVSTRPIPYCVDPVHRCTNLNDILSPYYKNTHTNAKWKRKNRSIAHSKKEKRIKLQSVSLLYQRFAFAVHCALCFVQCEKKIRLFTLTLFPMCTYNARAGVCSSKNELLSIPIHVSLTQSKY